MRVAQPVYISGCIFSTIWISCTYAEKYMSGLESMNTREPDIAAEGRAGIRFMIREVIPQPTDGLPSEFTL
jgi:hypothetical protein